MRSARLLARAARGRDLVALQPRRCAEPRPKPPLPQPPLPQTPDAQPEPPPPTRTRRPDPDDAPDPANLPTLEQMEAEIRRRPVGHAIAAICRDLGISPRLCEGDFWTRLYQAIDWHGGNFGKYYKAIRRRETDFEPEMNADPNLGVPEQTREGVRRMLGFVIGGEPPATPFWVCVPAGAYQAAAVRPP